MLRLFILSLLTSCLCATTPITVAAQKPLAPGVLKVIPATIDSRDTYSMPMPLLGLQSKPFSPNYAPIQDTLFGQSQNVVFFRDVWQYEYAFTGLRQAKLALSTSQGKVDQNVWYMMFRVRNTGVNASYDKVKLDERFEHIKNSLKRDDEKFEVKSRFKLDFYLNGWVKDYGGQYREVKYRDQLCPESQQCLRLIEDKDRFLMDKVEMMFAKFPVAKAAKDGERWGVAIWKGVDPKIDYVSVTVRGLTNAFRISTTAEGERKFKYRDLQLNFWRPGDSVREPEDDVDYGIPLVDDPAEQINICRKYRLPGPLIRGYLVSQEANQNVLLSEIDADIDLNTFQSSLTPLLDEGKLPKSIADSFKNAGIEIPQGTAITKDVAGKKWTFSLGKEEDARDFVIQLEPQYWKPKAGGGGIRFIKSLDHLWIYR